MNPVESPLTAVKFDTSKIRMSLLPPNSLKDIAEVFTFGANKYSSWNYLQGEGLKVSRILDSLHRHLNSFESGEDLDPESNKPHLSHIGCNIMMLIETMRIHPNNDDRFKK